MYHNLIPSFGRRKARKLKEQSLKAYKEILPFVRLTTSKELFDSLHSEIWLEIGFGGGEHLLEQLARNLSVCIIGCEPFMNGVAKLLTHLSPQDYERVRVWHEDVRYLLEMIPTHYFSRVFILFPDPWPKKRHQERRLIGENFITKLLPTLKEGAFLYVASDDPAYVEHIQKILYFHQEFTLCKGPPSADPTTWDPRPQDWPQTRYGQKALAKEKNCAYMIFQKRSSKEQFSSQADVGHPNLQSYGQ